MSDDLIKSLPARLRLIADDWHPICAEAADFIESQTKVVLAYIDQHARDSAELRRLCDERDKAKERVKALEAKCALLAASLAQSEREVEERDARIAALATVAPAVDAQPVAIYQVQTGDCWLDMTKEQFDNHSKSRPTRIVYTSAQSEGLMKDAWEPIETAPKTGRTLLLGYPNVLGKWRTVRGQWMSEAYIAESWEEPDDAEPGWYETAAEADDPPNCWPIEPTHWMPLPAPPAALCQKEAGK